MDSLSLIAATFDPLAGKALLDIGCGTGALVRALAARGARATGVDPSAEAIAAARANAPEAAFQVASAEHLPFADASFDGAIFLNALHHIPEMTEALREAGRVVRPGGRVVVVEPLAAGSFFAALRPVEDETAVRLAAQQAIEEALASGLLRLLRLEEFTRREAFDGLDPFLERIAAVDRSRAAAIAERRAAVRAAFEAAAARDEAGRYVLDQPLRAHVLAPA